MKTFNKSFIFSLVLLASLQILTGCASDGAVSELSDTGSLPEFDFGNTGTTPPTTVPTTTTPTKLNLETAKTQAVQNTQYLRQCLQQTFQFYDAMDSSTTTENIDLYAQRANEALINCYAGIAYQNAYQFNQIAAMRLWYQRIITGFQSVFAAIGNR